MGLFYVLIGVGIVAIVVASYNRLIALRQLTKNAWADVDVYLKRRAELIPNLVAAVKGYAGHEQALLTALAAARTQALSAGNAIPARSGAESAVGSQLFQVLMLAENYPDLKASGNFLNLQTELGETERMIASARQYYNACVRDLNTKIEAFPSSLLAGMIGMRHEAFFELDSLDERQAPSVAGSV